MLQFFTYILNIFYSSFSLLLYHCMKLTTHEFFTQKVNTFSTYAVLVISCNNLCVLEIFKNTLQAQVEDYLQDSAVKIIN